MRAGSSATTTDRLTALFTKRPRAGQVKTRLCPPLTPQQAAQLADAMLRDTVARCLRSDAFRTLLFHAPADEGGWFRSEFPGLELCPQRGEGLAQRLATGFADVFGRHAARTLVAIGSDQPLVGAARIAEAHEALEQGADCVLGPDQGGGYYLIGLRTSVPELFTGAPMSSADTLAATQRLASERGLAVRVLTPEQDVDQGEDLASLAAALEVWWQAGGAEQPDFPLATWRCLRDLAHESTPGERAPGGR